MALGMVPVALLQIQLNQDRARNVFSEDISRRTCVLKEMGRLLLVHLSRTIRTWLCQGDRAAMRRHTCCSFSNLVQTLLGCISADTAVFEK